MAEATAGALQIVQTQQNLVGKTVVGGASAVTGQSSDKVQVGILEQLRDISLKTFRATTKVAETLVNTLNFQKTKEARERDQASELSKESNVKGKSGGVGGAVTKAQGDAEKEGGKFVLFMGGLGRLFGTLLKPFKSLMNFVMKIGPIARLFTALGPVAGGLLRFTGIGTILFLLVKYADDIMKALEPVISAIGKTFEILKPVLTPIMGALDFLIKGAINQVGLIITAFVNVFNEALEFIVGAISGITDIVVGLFTLDFGRIGKGFKKIGETILNALKFVVSSIIDAIPFVPKKFKDKIKNAIGVGETKEEPGEADKQSGTGDVKADDKDKKELSSAFSSIEEKPATAEKIEKPTIKEETPKPKTVNMDKTSSAMDVAKAAKANDYEERLKSLQEDEFPPLSYDMYNLENITSFDERKAVLNRWIDGYNKAQKAGILGNSQEAKFRSEQLRLTVNQFKTQKKRFELAGQMGKNITEKEFLQKEGGSAIADALDLRNKSKEEIEAMNVEKFGDLAMKKSIEQRKLESEGQAGGVTVVNNQPTTVSNQNNVARSEVMVSRPNASTGDPYLDKQNYAAT